MISIADNLSSLAERVQRAAQSAGRQPDEVTLVAVSKFASADQVREAYQFGQRFFGESRIQECQDKIERLRVELSEAKWCLVGHLQSNKAGRAVALFDQVQSIDSYRIASKLNERASKANRTLEVLLEVNSSGEAQKYGVSFEQAPDLAERIRVMQSIKLTGLMTIGPQTIDKTKIRNAFARTRELFDSLKSHFVTSKLFGDRVQLSMGMSADFEIAIAEGATVIRIGTAIFGPRDSMKN